jgi:hypothetical protein
MEGEFMVIKCDIPGGNNMSSGKIKTPISSMIKGIAEKNTSRRASAEFVGGGSCLIWEAKTTKHPEMIKARRRTKEKLVWGKVATSTIRSSIDQMCSSGKGFNPECWWHACVEEQTPNAVIQGLQNALSFPVLSEV